MLCCEHYVFVQVDIGLYRLNIAVRQMPAGNQKKLSHILPDTAPGPYSVMLACVGKQRRE